MGRGVGGWEAGVLNMGMGTGEGGDIYHSHVLYLSTAGVVQNSMGVGGGGEGTILGKGGVYNGNTLTCGRRHSFVRHAL